MWALRHNNYEWAVSRVVQEGGDADSNAIVCGALLGCKLGISQIPSRWKEKLPHAKWLEEKVEKFEKEIIASSYKK